MVCQMWGYTYEELLGRPIGISDDTQQIPVHALEVVRSGGRFKCGILPRVRMERHLT